MYELDLRFYFNYLSNEPIILSRPVCGHRTTQGGRMKLLVAVVLVVISACAPAQPLLEFRNDLAFDVQIVDAAAARAYRARLKTFATDHRLDADPLLLNRLRRIVDKLKVAATIERADAALIPW